MIGENLMHQTIKFSKIYVYIVYIFDGVEICYSKMEN